MCHFCKCQKSTIFLKSGHTLALVRLAICTFCSVGLTHKEVACYKRTLLRLSTAYSVSLIWQLKQLLIIQISFF